MWGQLRIIQGDIRGLGKFKYEGAYKISWGFEKIEGARLSGGLLQRGVTMCPKEQQISDNLIVKDYCFIVEIFDKFSFSGILR